MATILRPYQEVVKSKIHKLVDESPEKNLMVVMSTGCLDGDTIIRMNRASKGFKTTLAEEFVNQYNKSRNKKIKSYIRAYDTEKNQVLLKRFDKIVFSGIKKTILLKSKTKTLICTPCHRILTKDGYVRADKMLGKEWLIDRHRPINSEKPFKKLRDDYQRVPMQHPFAPTVTPSRTERSYKKIEYHRFIYEMKMNKMNPEEYMRSIKDPEKVKSMWFLDTSKYHIHHINGDHYDNDENNLTHITIDEHLKHHANYGNFSQGIPYSETVYSITDTGMRATFDVVNSETSNFTANDIIVHNSGKTRTFCSFVNDVANKGKIVAIIVHRKELLSQISLTLCEEEIIHNIIAPPNVARQIIALQRMQFNKQFYHHASKVSIISVDTFNARADRYEDWVKSVDIAIIDEAAHVLKNNKWGRALSIFPKATKIGFTATPERLDKKGLGSWNDGIFDEMIEGPNVKWFIDNGFLSNYKIVAPPSDFEKYLGEVKSNTSDFSNEQIAEAAGKSQIIGDVVQNYIKFASGMQTIVFAPTLTIGKEMEKNFNNKGIVAKFLSSESTDRERFDGVQGFKDNKINILINVDLFGEGFDIAVAPNRKIIECVILARPTMSLNNFLQTVGRGLRVSPLKPHALIIDHVGNVKRHGLPCNTRKWSLERPKRKKQESRIKTCSECLAVYERFLTECPHCGYKEEKKSNGGGRVPPEMVDGILELIDPETIREMEAKTILESPDEVARRVSAAAGIYAGKKAAKNQMERIKTQKELINVIAEWAGKLKNQGYSDSKIHSEFYLEYGQTINEALSKPRLDMQNLIEDLKNE